MKHIATKIVKYLFLGSLLFAFGCTPDEDACFETVCYGPDGTDCVEEPNINVSGCFAPAP